MKLYELLEENPGEEITVWDEDNDLEAYFYGGSIDDKGNDEWDTAMYRLAKKLEVIDTEINDNRICATVNLSQIVENNLDNLKKANLFIKCNVDSIMDGMENILAGNVSEKWLADFVKALPRTDERFYQNYILSEEEQTGEGAERFCSVEIMYYNQCGDDDNYCGNLEECIKYCRDNGYILGIDARIADINCEDSTFQFCNDIYFDIPQEIFDAYDNDEWDDWDDEDVKAYAETLKNEDGFIDFDDVDSDEFLEFVKERKLKEILKKHEKWLNGEDDGERADLSQKNLCSANLSNVNLSGSNLSKAFLHYASLERANLRETNLCKANLSDANLHFANLAYVDLCEANLHGADLSGANLENANLDGADLRWADLSGADLENTNLVGADLHWAHLRGADLRGADLRGADLTGADLSKVDLLGARVTDEQLLQASGAPIIKAETEELDDTEEDEYEPEM